MTSKNMTIRVRERDLPIEHALDDLTRYDTINRNYCTR